MSPHNPQQEIHHTRNHRWTPPDLQNSKSCTQVDLPFLAVRAKSGDYDDDQREKRECESWDPVCELDAQELAQVCAQLVADVGGLDPDWDDIAEPLEAVDVGFQEARRGGDGGGSEEEREWESSESVDCEKVFGVFYEDDFQRVQENCE